MCDIFKAQGATMGRLKTCKSFPRLLKVPLRVHPNVLFSSYPLSFHASHGTTGSRLSFLVAPLQNRGSGMLERGVFSRSKRCLAYCVFPRPITEGQKKELPLQLGLFCPDEELGSGVLFARRPCGALSLRTAGDSFYERKSPPFGRSCLLKVVFYVPGRAAK